MDEKEEKKAAEPEQLLQEMQAHIDGIFEQYLLKNPEYENLKEFISEENNLYDEDGNLTEEYKKKIKEVEEFVKQNDITPEIIEYEQNDEIDNKTVTQIVDTVDEIISERKELLKDYSEHAYKDGFDVEKWILQKASEGLEEKETKIVADRLEDMKKEAADLAERIEGEISKKGE